MRTGIPTASVLSLWEQLLRLEWDSDAGLAKRAGISPATVNHWRSGRRKTVQASILRRIGDNLGYKFVVCDKGKWTITKSVAQGADKVDVVTAIRASADFYREALDNVPSAVFIHRDNVLFYANTSFYRLTGLEDPEHSGHPLDWTAVVHPDDKLVLRSNSEKALKGTVVPFTTCRIRDAHENWIVVEAAMLPLNFAGIRVVEVVVRPVLHFDLPPVQQQVGEKPRRQQRSATG